MLGRLRCVQQVQLRQQHFQARHVAQVARAVAENEKVLPFSSIPGPKVINRAFFPGGECYNKSFVHMHGYFRKIYGNIVRLPAMLGRPHFVLTCDPEDFGPIFRNEGVWPIRRGFETITFYRKKLRPDVFKSAGLLSE